MKTSALYTLGLVFAGWASASELFGKEPASHYHHEDLPGHSLRIRKTDPSVCAGNKGISGYVDIDEGDKHLFFWAFESRNDPVNDPLLLWMTGGPGCSGIAMGLLIEMGPCVMDPKTGKTMYNPHAWNNNATVIFIDQPVNVGFSYSSQLVQDLKSSTTDTHNFLRLFFHAFPATAKLDFYIAGESYGGSWVPTLASRIVKSQDSEMAKLAKLREDSLFDINLKGIILGNVVIDETSQWKGFYPTACKETKLLNDTLCAQMAAAMPRCNDLLELCHSIDFDMTICGPVLHYCRENSFFLLFEEHPNVNMYNFNQQCEAPGGLCYKIIGTTEAYLNDVEVKKKLGISSALHFESCNFETNGNFTLRGDTNRGSQKHLTYVLDMGLKVLVFAGTSDWTANAAGLRYMVDELPWADSVRFREAEMIEWGVTINPQNNKLLVQNIGLQSVPAEQTKIVGKGKTFGKLTFLEVPQAGHMVPLDRPAESQEMISDWLNDGIKWRR